MRKRKSSTRGFKQAGALLSQRIRKAGESRGFVVSRVLTHWDEIAGPKIAAVARPVDVSYGRGSLGATLTVLTTGAQAPLLEMQKEQLRDRVNAAYGYNAIARVRITQTAATGFSEGKVEFARPNTQLNEMPVVTDKAREAAGEVGNADLRHALEQLGANVLSKAAPSNGRTQ